MSLELMRLGGRLEAGCKAIAAGYLLPLLSGCGGPRLVSLKLMRLGGRLEAGCKANCRVPAAPPVWMWRPEAGVPGAGEGEGGRLEAVKLTAGYLLPLLSGCGGPRLVSLELMR